MHSSAGDLQGYSIYAADGDLQILYTSLTKEQVKNSPDIETDRPVAEQQEIEYYDYYRVNPYWGSGWQVTGPAAGPAGTSAYVGPHPSLLDLAGESAESEILCEEQGDPHLRSTKEVAGYTIGATDGEVGHVEDFVVDDEEWTIRYTIVDTRNWLPGKKVLLSPRWVSQIGWLDKEVYLDLERGEIYIPSATASREAVENYLQSVRPTIADTAGDFSRFVNPNVELQDQTLALSVEVESIERADQELEQGLEALQLVEVPEGLEPIHESLVEAYERALPAYDNVLEAFRSGDLDQLAEAVQEGLPEIAQFNAEARAILQELERVETINPDDPLESRGVQYPS